MEEPRNTTPENPHARYMPGYVEPADQGGQCSLQSKATSSITSLQQEEQDAGKMSALLEEEDAGRMPALLDGQNAGLKPAHLDDQQLHSAWLRRTSNVLSAVFSPLIVPTYAYTIMLLITRLSRIMPERLYVTSTLIIFAITAMVPMSVILFMVRTGRIDDYSIRKSSQRAVPYVVTVFCYFAAVVYLMRLPSWVSGFFVGAAAAVVIDSIINVWWKISAHATAMGGLTAMLIFIGLARMATVLIIPWISTAILISGAVCSARVFLGRHTLGQVFCGWLVGAVCTIVAMLSGLILDAMHYYAV